MISEFLLSSHIINAGALSTTRRFEGSCIEHAYIIHFVFQFQFQNVRLKGKKQSSHENTKI